ncbi:UDP-N-acetylmuramoyl-L-alanyl-D-glutamate--2,6-diaminopimelate ligase [Mesosutterella sp. OilRF-GAM-744-9]|uniref:UDP-N-acetylmuramoyl-L-alanyl-D-glutamate--2,6-diaminopimelate ligase n=1 Tax=Mesosutterella porci TaxID=2915351 RepID=A0ABS9MTC7_9BURK|nr:UDP-N-acetylmuramoyl-L-alanyl-D-glutamate--2,6-diaminopimelate ligase [Mesosutterella sp. oilRF-744-WT-GAM-9]MCG5031253.1 UDP-N-acetylmuramoyl-L-alanyl-D-glutamate--2,6-diaminopimelate ligase [Mesosutterella sp. oilRF-744-WT-GAM-9]
MSEATLGEALQWLKQKVAADAQLELDSRRVAKGDVFLAVPGLSADGRRFMQAAADAGAGAVLYEAQGAQGVQPPDAVPSLAVKGLAASLGGFASAYYGEPSRRLSGAAVTGTNGKTTTSQWMGELFTRLGQPCAVLGTIGCSMAGRSYSAVPLTTPDPVTIQRLLHAALLDGARAFAIEASSIGLVQGRLDGTRIRWALFTNLTRDHLDYHKTMQAYEDAKALLFERPELEAAVVNIDDPAGARMCRTALAHGVRTIAATSRGTAVPEGCEALEARDVEVGASGVSFRLAWKGRQYPVQAKALGLFNVDNLLGAAGVVLASGAAGAEQVAALLGELLPPPGRLQQVRAPGMPLGVVDYCHTPDAIDKALETLRPVARARGGRLWIVVGAGGNRDHGKRPLMGRSAAAGADRVIVTTDNPRFEDPLTIAQAVAAGAGSPRIILDRAEAIQMAVSEAAPEDVILVAGKGHETYQEVRGVRHHFSDAEALERAFGERARAARRNKEQK